MKLFFKRRPAVSSAAVCKLRVTVQKAELLSMYLVVSLRTSIYSMDSLFLWKRERVGDVFSEVNRLPAARARTEESDACRVC